MHIVEPHIHMYSRTTDDYQRMYEAGIRVCVEPSFWMGTDRRHAGSFFDYFRLILEFETVRASRFGIDHYAAVSLNPKEAEDPKLAGEVIDGMAEHLAHPRCLAVGEIGLNNITPNEAKAFERQLHMAHSLKMLAVVHMPHFNKAKGIDWVARIVANEGIPPETVLIDHNTEESMKAARDTGCYAGMTVYPISKLDPERASRIIKEYGVERMIVDGSADWGVSDPLSLVKVAERMRLDGHPESAVRAILLDNPSKFYGQSPKWKPDFGIKPLDPREFQR